MTAIPLANNRGVAYVDDADAAMIQQYKWVLKRCKNDVTDGYAWTRLPGSRDHVYMHRLLCPGFPRVDHIDGDGLNNQRSNLRGCTHQENLRHQRAQKGRRFKGVRFRKDKATQARPWQAYVDHKHIGYFATEEEGARAYDEEAVKRFGEFAWLNFPEVLVDVDLAPGIVTEGTVVFDLQEEVHTDFHTEELSEPQCIAYVPESEGWSFGAFLV